MTTPETHRSADAVPSLPVGAPVDDGALKTSALGALEIDPNGIAARVAGGVLIANVALIVVTALVMRSYTAAVGPISSPVPYIIDVLIGASLLSGNRKWIPFAIFRAVLGGVVVSAMLAFQGDLPSAVLQVAYSAAILLLLVGRPARLRFRVGAALAGALALMTALAPFAVSAVDGETTAVPNGVLDLEQFTMRVEEEYRLRDPVAAAKDNPDAAAWLVDDLRDAHVIVVCEDAEPDLQYEGDEYMGAVLAALSTTDGYAERSRTPARKDGELTRSRAVVDTGADGLAISYLLETVVTPERACAGYAFAAKAGFSGVVARFERMLGTLAVKRAATTP